MYALEVAPITSSILKESLTYFSKTPVEPGVLVTIPLRKREVRGIVLSSSPVQNIKQNLRHQNFKIRNITTIHDEIIFSSAYLKTIQQLKNYYLVNTGKLIDITYPRVITKNLSDFTRTKSHNINTDSIHIATPKLIQQTYSGRVSEYISIAQEHLKQDQSLHIICPTIHQVKKIAADLVAAGITPYPLHSKTTAKKVTATYTDTQHTTSIVISTASFIDAPALNKKTLILEQDSSTYYTRAVAPVIDMRILVEQYAKHSGHALIYADNLLRPLRYKDLKIFDEDIFVDNKLHIVSAKEKITKKQTDAERVKDLSQKKPFAPLSDKVLKKIKTAVSTNEKIFCYVPRKSLAPHIVCRTCGLLACDKETGAPYSLFLKTNPEMGEKERIYINKTTNEQVPAFDICQHCSSWQLQMMGVGTDSVVEQLQTEFPGTAIFACDSFHTKTDAQTRKLFTTYNSIAEEDQAAIMIGTQKALPYLDTIDTSIIVSIDGMLSQMSYTTEFRTLYLIKNITDTTRGMTFVQTRTELSSVLPSLAHNNYPKHVEQTLKNSQEIGASPYGAIMNIHHVFQRPEYEKLYQLYAERLRLWQPHISTRPHPKKGQVEMKVLLHLKNTDWNINSQNLILSEKLPFEERNIHIEINPDVF